MKLILERIDGELFLYHESEKYHKKMEPQREARAPRVSKALMYNVLRDECALDSNPLLGNDFYTVFDLK